MKGIGYMGIEEEYQKVIDLLEKLKSRILDGRICFRELGGDLIAELAAAVYEVGHSEEERCAANELINAYVNEYKAISRLNNRDIEIAYLDTMISSIQAWMFVKARQEKELIDNIKDVQSGVLPEEMANIENGKIKHITMDVRELFLQQNADIFKMDYQRLDIIVKYLAIENYYGKNDYGFNLHQKLQKLRKNQSAYMPEGYELISREAFRNLIQSIEKNGWDNESEISVDNRLFLTDGAHRVAACLYFGIEHVRVQVLDDEIDILPFTVDYLENGGFTKEEVNIICKKAEELLERCKVKISCVLWPPVEPYFDQIRNEISPDCEYKDYIYSEETFPRIVRGIYHIDDIDDWKIQMKIDAMSKCPVKKIRYMQLEVLAPYFRLKQMNAHTISVVGENIKQVIREKYSKLVDNYIYDIIIHTGDNFEQSEYIKKLFEQPFSLEEYFSAIADEEYFLIKNETPYTPIDFPKSYAFSKDIDIICSTNDYDNIKMKTNKFLEKNINGYEIRKISKDNGTLYRVELNGFLIIQLDIGTGVQGISPQFWTIALKNRIEKDGYYIPLEKDEVCIRVNEYMKSPQKVHHLEYLKRHKKKFDKQYILENINCTEEQLDMVETAI